MTKLKARPTIYKGIQMRSRLEAGFATWLDKYQFDWAYEPYALATEAGQYLPDFVLQDVFATWLPEPVRVIVEVKPQGFSVDGRSYPLDDPVTCDQQCRPSRGKLQAIHHSDECSIEVAFRRRQADWQQINQQAMVVWQSDPHSLMLVAQPNRLSLMVRDANAPQERVALRARIDETAKTDTQLARWVAELCGDDDGPSAVHWVDWSAVEAGLVNLPDQRIGLECGRPEHPWQGEFWKPGK